MQRSVFCRNLISKAYAFLKSITMFGSDCAHAGVQDPGTHVLNRVTTPAHAVPLTLRDADDTANGDVDAQMLVTCLELCTYEQTACTGSILCHVRSDLSWHWHVMGITECKSSVLYQIVKDHVGQLHLHVCLLPCDTLGIHLLCLHQTTAHWQTPHVQSWGSIDCSATCMHLCTLHLVLHKCYSRQ